MANTGEDHAGVEGEESPFDRRVFRALFDLAKQVQAAIHHRQPVFLSVPGLDLTAAAGITA